jgi:diadenosine tetraphosphate (Ap4A) HIT family hydrolase
MPEHCRICDEIARFSPEVTIRDAPTASAVAPARGRVLGTVMIVVHRHVDSFASLDEIELADVTQLIQDVSPRVLQALRADGLSIWWHTGAVAGQTDPHFYVEVVPRFAGVPYPFGATGEPSVWSDEERRNLARQLVQ